MRHHVPLTYAATHQYSHLPSRTPALLSPSHEPADDCFGVLDERFQERFIFVGEERGDYEQSLRGNFHYVGPNQGHFLKQRLPPKRKWRRIAFLICVMLLFIVAGALLLWYVFFAPVSAFDCYAGLERASSGWSDLKREYCCENEGLGCQAGVERDETVPAWLDVWLWDFSLGIKFTASAALCLLIGCCCGAGLYYWYLAKHAPKHRTLTEVELSAEIRKLLGRLGARTGELSVTLMWDTVDDLDLHLRLPGDRGEISSEVPKLCGGILDIDGNHILETATTKPIENITWPEYDPLQRNNPPIGEYTVFVKVFARFQNVRDPNITVFLNVAGQQELFHQRITACCCEVKVCSFIYEGPGELPSHYDP